MESKLVRKEFPNMHHIWPNKQMTNLPFRGYEFCKAKEAVFGLGDNLTTINRI
jgi:hypothetical protein